MNLWTQLRLRPRRLAAILTGSLLAVLWPGTLAWQTRTLIGWNLAVWIYLPLIVWMMFTGDAARHVQQRARRPQCACEECDHRQHACVSRRQRPSSGTAVQRVSSAARRQRAVCDCLGSSGCSGAAARAAMPLATVPIQQGFTRPCKLR